MGKINSKKVIDVDKATIIKIDADSSCDLFRLDSTEFATASMKVITAEREFFDDEKLDVSEMVERLDSRGAHMFCL